MKISVAFQPVVRLDNQALLHYEMLARVPGHPQAHRELIRHTEAAGIIYLIDQQILRHAHRTLREDTRDQLRLAINVSADTLNRIGPAYLAQVLALPWAIRSRMMIEITETAPLRDLAFIDHFVVALEQADVAVGLDDLGAGHFTPREIRRWRPTMVKIDGGLIEDLLYGPNRELEAIKEAANDCQATLIAEYVDVAEKIPLLLAAGIDYGQGNLIAPAQSQPAYQPKEFSNG